MRCDPGQRGDGVGSELSVLGSRPPVDKGGEGDLWADWGGGGAGGLPERYLIKQSSESYDGV